MGLNNRKRRKKHTVLALDFGSYAIKGVVGFQNDNKLKTVGMFMLKVPSDAYENGNILDFDALKAALTDEIKKQNIKVKDVYVTFESTDMIKREMIIQKVDESDIMDLLMYEIAQYLPIKTYDYIFQYKVLEEFFEDDVAKLRVLLGAIPKTQVEDHHALVKACGLNPVVLDMHSNAKEKVLKLYARQNPRAEEMTVAFIDMGHKMIDISIYENLSYQFNRILRMGCSSVDKIIARHLNLEEEAAREIKEGGNEIPNLIEADEGTKVLMKEDINEYLDECIDEISKVLKYHINRSTESKIDLIVFLGGMCNVSGFIDHANEQFSTKCIALTELNLLDMGSKVKSDSLFHYANALGALIRTD